VFFDGECPLCQREIGLLRKLDRRGRIRFTDIAADGFGANAIGIPHEELLAEIHGRTPDGQWVRGVEVFRQLYSALGIGLSPLVALSRLPGVAHVLDWGYGVFARNRLKWTGRCETGRCGVPGVQPRSVPVRHESPDLPR
jgi:predicted DCC family thiol-disulfide oxidoreductase YuxK